MTKSKIKVPDVWQANTGKALLSGKQNALFLCKLGQLFPTYEDQKKPAELLNMSFNIGIIGLPKSGRTTVFNALTKGRADTGSYSREALAPHIGVAKVPEPRLVALANMLQPKKVTPAEVRYIDIGDSVKVLAKDHGIGGELLNQLASADSLINVVRAFTDESVPHIEGSLDVARDIETMNLEIAFSDLVLQERRLEKITLSLKGAITGIR